MAAERGRVAARPATSSTSPAVLGLSDLDLYLFNEGRHFELYDHMGAHPLPAGAGARFAVWAPNAAAVSVVHDGNGWTPESDRLEPQGSSGIWAGVVEGMPPGTRYKYRIEPRSGRPRDKADPFAFRTEEPPSTASVFCPLEYAWGDGEWLAQRAEAQADPRPMSIYEVHLGSWRRRPDHSWMTYDEVAEPLADHVLEEGFTHVELLPIMEHPFYGSWGYQTTGYFAPTARYGDPLGFMRLVDHLHKRGIGVILDWVPSHFATDEFSLGEFDGTHLYEHADPRQRVHPDWGATSSTTGDTRCARSSSRAPGSGWTATTPTDCGSTPWPRCSTSTTRESPGAGSRTATGGGRTSTPWNSSASSTTPCTAASRASSRSPRSRPPGPGSPGRRAPAGSASR